MPLPVYERRHHLPRRFIDIYTYSYFCKGSHAQYIPRNIWRQISPWVRLVLPKNVFLTFSFLSLCRDNVAVKFSFRWGLVFCPAIRWTMFRWVNGYDMLRWINGYDMLRWVNEYDMFRWVNGYDVQALWILCMILLYLYHWT